MLYFLLSTLVLTLYIDVVLSLSIKRMYPECFGKTSTGGFSVTKKLHHNENAEPRIHAPRRLAIEKMESTKESLEQMVQDGIIAKVEGPTDWVSSMVVREKTDGKLRLCLDTSDLNKALKREHYPSRTTEEVNHKFVNAKLFTKLDAKNGYWNVKLDEESSFLTTFNTPFGRYRFLRLPFGLKVSQDIFQCLMDDAYQNCHGAVNIADDVVVYGRDEKDHDRNLHEAMEKTRKSGIKLNDRPEKCQVKKESVKFYGNMYTTEGTITRSEQGICDQSHSTTQQQGRTSYFSRNGELHGKICEELSRPYSENYCDKM